MKPPLNDQQQYRYDLYLDEIQASILLVGGDLSLEDIKNMTVKDFLQTAIRNFIDVRVTPNSKGFRTHIPLL